MELKRDLRRAAAPALTARPPFPAQRFRTFPATESLPAAPPLRPPIRPTLPPGVPMDVDASRQRLEVRFLAPEEQEELLLQLLAARDSAGVPSPDAATLEDCEEEAPSNPAEVEVAEGDF
ncbi:hypothetical protein C0992_011011 [Termitomyces sp. T32_za158]|nr:hypothetical protein C0992_011011 [Termitomyces sp. T32_za158]